MIVALCALASFLGAALGCAAVGWWVNHVLRRVHAAVTQFGPVQPHAEGTCAVCGVRFFNPTDSLLQPCCSACVMKER